MASWVAARLDVSSQTATRLIQVAKADRPEIDTALSSARFGLDRAALLTRLHALDVSDELISEAAEGYSPTLSPAPQKREPVGRSPWPRCS